MVCLWHHHILSNILSNILINICIICLSHWRYPLSSLLIIPSTCQNRNRSDLKRKWRWKRSRRNWRWWRKERRRIEGCKMWCVRWEGILPYNWWRETRITKCSHWTVLYIYLFQINLSLISLFFLFFSFIIIFLTSTFLFFYFSNSASHCYLLLCIGICL